MTDLPVDERLRRIKKGLCLDCDKRAVSGLLRCAEHDWQRALRRMPGRRSVCGEPAGRKSKCEEHRREIGE